MPGFCARNYSFEPVSSKEQIRQRLQQIKRLTRKTRQPLLYDVEQSIADTGLIRCSKERKRQWYSKYADLTENYPHLADQIHRNRQDGWTVAAADAVEATVAVLKFLELPAILNGGVLLSWYRQCGVAEFANDVDVVVPFDYLLSDEHAYLMEVVSRSSNSQSALV